MNDPSFVTKVPGPGNAPTEVAIRTLATLTKIAQPLGLYSLSSRFKYHMPHRSPQVVVRQCWTSSGHEVRYRNMVFIVWRSRRRCE